MKKARGVIMGRLRRALDEASSSAKLKQVETGTEQAGIRGDYALPPVNRKPVDARAVQSPAIDTATIAVQGERLCVT
jgi:hypothetical protein